MIVRLALFVLLSIPAVWLAGAADAADPASGKIRVLIVGGQNNHDWKLGNAFHLALLARQPGIVAEESNTPPAKAPREAWDAWKPEFKKYAVVLLNYNGEMWPDERKAEFEQYLNEGGNAMPLHAANNSFTGWGAYEQAVGLLWRHAEFGATVFFDAEGKLQREEKGQGPFSSHGKQYDWKMTVRDTAHPITAGMPVHWLHRMDELYHGQRGPAENLHILLSAASEKDKGGTGRDEPIVWWVPVGKGRMLTNLMGHLGDTACLSCIGYQTVLLRSIEWLAKGSVSTPIPADFPVDKTAQDYPGGVARILPGQKPVEESLKRFKLPPGYRIELAAREPMIVNPVCFNWDADGALYVCEMRTYMMDGDATGQGEAKSRVSKLIDKDGDGVYETATVFVDNLVLPRMVLPLDDRVVIAETYTGKFVSYKDTDGDGVADEKVEVFDGGPSKSNLEHQDSALTWGTDNRLYTAMLGSRRFRIGADLKWISEPIYGRGSQWGLAQDDLGRFVSSVAGGENGAFGFQQHPSYGALSLPDELDEDFQMLYPRMQTLDVQGGLGRVHPIKGTINHITACAGQSIYRGDRLPAEMYGSYLLPEPVGRLVRRATVTVVEGKRVLTNAYPGDEFITSTDPAFRPVWSATGPDGCLYIGDMGNGIIQESAWNLPGQYLRQMVDRDGHAKIIGQGRIWRVMHESTRRGPAPALKAKKPAELVAALAHPNGWWRDTAQQLLVLRGDKSVVPALQALALGKDGNALGRAHALWTLDGLGASDRATLVAAFKDADPRVRITAIRVSEALFKAGDAALAGEYATLAKDKDLEVVVQVLNSLRYSKDPEVKKLILAIEAKHPYTAAITATAQQSYRFDPDKPAPFNAKLDGTALALAKKGNEHFSQLCFACHGIDGKGVKSSDGIRMGPSLAGSARVLGNKEAVTRIVLHGLMGELDGQSYAGLMLPMKGNDDQWIAEVLTYVRTAFGNNGSVITPEDVAAIRAASKDRAAPFTMAELKSWLPVPTAQMAAWKVSASINPQNAGRATDGDAATRWDTGGKQEAGQWFQIDFAKPWVLNRLTIDAQASSGDWPRGWELSTSDDGTTWSKPLAKGESLKSPQPLIDIPFATPPTARFIRVTQTAKGATGNFWSINELVVYGEAKK